MRLQKKVVDPALSAKTTPVKVTEPGHQPRQVHEGVRGHVQEVAAPDADITEKPL